MVIDLEGQLRIIINPKTKGGGSGEDGSGTITSSTQGNVSYD